MIRQPPDLDSLYGEAQEALASKDLERAAGLLKQILLTDEDYKDASRLLAQTVARQRRRWYKDARLWIAVGVAALLGILFLFKDSIVRIPAKPEPTEEAVALAPTITSQPTRLLVPTVTPTTVAPSATEPTAIPLHWRRLYAGAIFPRAEISSIAVDPNDPDLMYVGTVGAGIYRSLDGGLSWQPALTNLGLRDILAVAIDPLDPGTMYAGTDGEGFYRSDDAGMHWERLYDSGSDLIIDRQNNDHLILAAGQVLVESVDGGNSWSEIRQTSLCPASYDKIAVDPAIEDVLYALDLGACGKPGMGAELYGSTDGGDQWALLNQRSGTFGLLDVEATSNGEVYSLAGGGGAGGGILRSANGGRTWSWHKQLPMLGGEHGALLMPVDSPDTILAGSVGLQISHDGGKTWEVRQDGLGAAMLNLILNPRDPLNLFIESRGCLYYRSEDGGLTWTEIEVEWCGLSIDADGVVYTEGMRSWDRGRHWDEAGPYVGYIIAADPGESGLLYADGFTSTNGGETWLPSGRVGLERNARLFVGENILYAFDSLKLRYSLDRGGTWDECGDTVGWPPSTTASAAIDPADDERIFLATRAGGIQFSETGCMSWESRNEGLGSLYANAVAIDPTNPERVYAGTDGGAYVSFDSGEHWGQINDGLLGATVVYSIVVDPQRNVYAATPYGIFKLESS